MNWDAVGAFAEIIGALGVIASLIYLAYQIRQNTEGLRLAARMSLRDQNTEYTKLLLSDPTIGALYARTNPISYESMRNPLRLTDEELITHVRLQYIAFVNLEDQYRAFQSGLLSEDEWAAPRALLADVYLSSEAVRDYWHAQRRLHGPSFAELVDRIISERYAA